MKKFTFLLLILFSITAGYGQLVANYTFSQSTGNAYSEITGGTQVVGCTDCVTSYDTNQYVIALPSSFPFNGTTVNSVVMRVDGSLVLGVTTAPTNSTTPISSTITATGAIAGLAMDMRNTQIAGLPWELRWEEVGSEFVFQWKNAARWSQGTVEKINFQIRVNKSTGVIRIAYGLIEGIANSTTYQPQVGLRGATASDYNARNLTSTVPTATPSWDNTALATSNSATVRFTSGSPAAFPTTGLTYTYTPPAPCTGTPVAGTVSTTLNRFICNGSAPGVITVTGATSLIPGITYQWQESLNGTDWANATGGSGATTLSYTPPNFGGATIQYRLKVACAGGSEAYSEVTTVNLVTNPSTQVSALVFSAQQTNNFNVAWTNGNGTRRMVVVNSTNTFTDPVNGNGPALTAAAAYAGTGQQIVYDGTGSNVTITGLACNATYYVKVYEYNRCGSGPYDYYYNATSGTNTGSTMTTQPVLATGLSSIDFTGFTGTNLSTVFPGWYEASIATTGGTEPSSVNPAPATSAWTSATAFGSTTARVNLYTNTINAWIISPKMAITANTRLNFKAAITDYSSATAGATTADAARMQGTDDRVRVMVSTDGCGANWTTLYTFNAANTTALTNQLTDFSILLTPYVGQTIQVAFQAIDGPLNDDPDYDFHIGNIVLEEVPACDIPTVTAATTVGKNTATINWAAPASGSPTGYQYVVSTANTAPSGAGTPAAGLTANIASLSPLTTYYVFVRSVCGSDFSDWSASGTFTTLCEYPDITGVTGGSVCGQGAVPLSVAAASGQFVWYNAATAGNVVGTGTTFTTPVINTTTNYYVSSSTPTPDSNVAIGAGATTSATYSNPFYSAWSNNHTQHLITAQDLYAAGLGAGPINSIALDVTAAGTLPMIDLSIKIGASNAAALTAFTDNSAFATVYTSASYLPTAGVNTFTFTTPFVWDGVSNIVVEFCHGNASSTSTMSRTVKADNTTYASTVKFHTSAATAASVACGATTGTNLTSYTLRPQFIFNGTKLCLSPRQAVTATVTAPPALTLSTAAAAICAGQSATVTVTAGASDYNTYVWSPATGVTGNEVTGWTFSPAATTTYTLTASQTSGAMCAVTKTVAITVNALPGAIGITAPTTPVCLDDIVTLTATGPVTSSTATIGTATTATGTTDEMTAFCNRRVTYKSQTIYTAAEMTAAGLQAGNIVSVAYTINSIGTSANNSNYLVKIGSTTLAAFPSTNYLDESGFTTVYGPVAQTHAVGTNVITFTTPYVWDGTSNIVISVSMGGADGLYNAETLYTDLGANTTLYNYNNMAATTGTYTTRRFNITLATSAAGSVTWTPATNLYTNAAATVPYVAGTGAVSVYAKSAVPVSTQYTATLTNEAGCVSTATATVNAVDCDINWANLQHPANGTINTCGTHAVYAQVYKAGVTEAAGQGANITAWVGVSTSNTDPSTWVEAEWHLATFNVQNGNNDEYMYTISGVPAGTYYYASRFRYLNGDFYYGGYNSGAWDGTTNVNGQLTVNAIAAPTVADATPEFCNSAAVSALQATGSGIKWYDEATGGTALEATVALTNGGTYYASQTVDGCESTARTLVTVTINVIAAPTADATLTVCNAGTVVDLQATGTAIKWYDEATGGVALEATVALTNGGTYYASQTVDGCESIARALVTVTVNAPAAPTAAATQTFCDAGTVAGLTATGVAGAAISWYDEATGGVALDGTTALTNGGTYYASQTVTGCESTARTLVTVTISTVSAPVTTVTQPTCTEPTGSIAITSPVGADYTYSVDGTNFQAATSFDGLAPGVYTVTAKNAAGCIATAQATIDIAPVVPDAPVTVVTQPTCNEPTGSIGITSPVGADYTYSVDGTTFQASTSFDGLAPGVYTVTVQNTTGCVSTAQVTIDIAPVVPDAPVTTLTQPTCAVATGTIEVTSPLADAYTYSIDGTTFGPSSIFENVAPGTYTVTVQSPQGCTSTATVVINDAPAVPDAPTGDETQTITAGTAEEATIEDIVVTAAGTVTWYPTAEDAMSGTNAIEAGTQLTNGSTYYGTQTVGGCTSAYIAVLVDLVLGKDDFGRNAFSVYPNPVRDILNISYTTEITSVTVHNLLGQQVLAKQPNAAEVKIDLSGLADATYIVNVTAGNTVKTIKVVKKQ